MSEKLEFGTVFEEYEAKLSPSQQRIVDLSQVVLATRSQEIHAGVVELPLNLPSAVVEEILRTGVLKKYMPQVGETLSDKENPELFPDLGLVVGEAHVSAVKIVAGCEVAQDEEPMRRVGLHFYYDNDHNVAVLEVSAVVTKSSIGRAPLLYSKVHTIDYHDHNYHGHNHKHFAVDEEGMLTFCDVVEGLLQQGAEKND